MHFQWASPHISKLLQNDFFTGDSFTILRVAWTAQRNNGHGF